MYYHDFLFLFLKLKKYFFLVLIYNVAVIYIKVIKKRHYHLRLILVRFGKSN